MQGGVHDSRGEPEADNTWMSTASATPSIQGLWKEPAFSSRNLILAVQDAEEATVAPAPARTSCQAAWVATAK